MAVVDIKDKATLTGGVNRPSVIIPVLDTDLVDDNNGSRIRKMTGEQLVDGVAEAIGVSQIQTDIADLETDVLAINTELAEKEAEITALQGADTTLQQNITNETTARSEADLERLKSVIVPTYADMLTQATGDQVLIFGVIADEVNMGGDKGAYIYIPSFGIGQIAINFS